jgi:hypothetical protein
MPQAKPKSYDQLLNRRDIVDNKIAASERGEIVENSSDKNRRDYYDLLRKTQQRNDDVSFKSR